MASYIVSVEISSRGYDDEPSKNYVIGNAATMQEAANMAAGIAAAACAHGAKYEHGCLMSGSGDKRVDITVAQFVAHGWVHDVWVHNAWAEDGLMVTDADEPLVPTATVMPPDGIADTMFSRMGRHRYHWQEEEEEADGGAAQAPAPEDVEGVYRERGI